MAKHKDMVANVHWISIIFTNLGVMEREFKWVYPLQQWSQELHTDSC
jgi:hypothetical protein